MSCPFWCILWFSVFLLCDTADPSYQAMSWLLWLANLNDLQICVRLFKNYPYILSLYLKNGKQSIMLILVLHIFSSFNSILWWGLIGRNGFTSYYLLPLPIYMESIGNRVYLELFCLCATIQRLLENNIKWELLCWPPRSLDIRRATGCRSNGSFVVMVTALCSKGRTNELKHHYKLAELLWPFQGATRSVCSSECTCPSAGRESCA